MEHNIFCKFMAHYRKDGVCYCDTEMQPPELSHIDPHIIQQGADLYDYEAAEKVAESIKYQVFAWRLVSKNWVTNLGWRRFFVLDWWKFKFGLSV